MARRTPVKASPRSKSPSPAPMLAGALVILIAAVAVIFIIGATEEPPPAAPPAEVVDPFAGIPDELPPGARPPAAPRAAADPFAGVGVASDSATPAGALALGDAWERARALAEEGLALVERAARAKQDGDLAGFKAAGADAKAKLEQALEVSRELAEDLIREHGEAHPDARALERERTKWRGELVALKKTVGL